MIFLQQQEITIPRLFHKTVNRQKIFITKYFVYKYFQKNLYELTTLNSKGYFVPENWFYTIDSKFSDAQIQIKQRFGIGNPIKKQWRLKFLQFHTISNLFEEVLNEFTKLNLCKKMYDMYKNEKQIYKSR